MQNKQTQTSDSFFSPTEEARVSKHTKKVPIQGLKNKKQAFVVRSQHQIGILDLKVGKQSPSSEEE